MKIFAPKLLFKLLILILMLTDFKTFAQVVDFNTIPKSSLDNRLIGATVSNSLLVQNIANFKDYPSLSQYRGQHIFSINDSIYGKIPFKLYIPKNYNPSQPVPLIMLLHGAVGLSKFSDALGTNTEVESDPFYKKLCESGFVIVMPYADPEKGFNWAANKFGMNHNSTFNSLNGIINEIKKAVNIDDNKIFAFGHSDGSDGAFALDVYQSSIFAGFVGYNSMLTNLFANNFYPANAINRPLYLVHSDKDDLRPIEQTRSIVKMLDSLKVPIKYKEYYGYQHQDSHLDKDLPYAMEFINSTQRNPFPKTLYWETEDHAYNKCDWIVIEDWNLSLPNAQWHQPHNVFGYNKLSHTWYNMKYYNLSPSAAIKGSYGGNVFQISTSRVTKFEVLISPQMVDLNKEVKVVVNGNIVFNGKVKPDNSFCLNRFLKERDRKAIWVTSVIIDTNLSK